MAGASLLTLLDDIAAVLDDVALMSKVAAKKTAGVLGDDLALNAEQVSGVKADRELPVVWAVAKGSLVNKVILVPVALLLSYFLPVLITPLLVIGGLFLCFEGVEKVLHSLQKKASDEEHQQELAALADPNIDLVTLEKDKIKGAIRTDFILSAEIIVIALGTVTDASLTLQAITLSVVALGITLGVYGLVAIIVKLDDMGLYLLRKRRQGFTRVLGRGLLAFAPKLMKFLAIAGTIAMFLVGGGIVVHATPPLTEWLHHVPENWHTVSEIGLNMLTGFIAGAIVLAIISVAKKIKG